MGAVLFTLIRAIFGSVDAQLSLAIENWYGPSERQNAGRARYWAGRASRNGSAEASLILASMNADSSTPQRTNLEIYAAFKQAAAAGDVAGQFNLGCCYEQGVGVLKNPGQALYWYTLAAVNGDQEAQLAVGRLCSSADGAGKTADSADQKQ